MNNNNESYNDIFLNPEIQKFMEEQSKLIEERKKTVKYGKNVVHLKYVGEFNEVELQEINKILVKGGLEFSRYNKSGIIQNNLDLYQLVSALSISHPLLVEILAGVSSSFAWDAIKLSTIKIWEMLKVKKYNKINGRKIEERDVTFGIKVRLDGNTKFDFELKGDISKEDINESLDKILEFLKEQPLNERPRMNDYVYYNSEVKQWIKIDVEEELHKIALEKTYKPGKDNKPM